MEPSGALVLRDLDSRKETPLSMAPHGGNFIELGTNKAWTTAWTKLAMGILPRIPTRPIRLEPKRQLKQANLFTIVQ